MPPRLKSSYRSQAIYILCILLAAIGIISFIHAMRLPLMTPSPSSLDTRVFMSSKAEPIYLLSLPIHFIKEGDFIIGLSLILFSILIPILKFVGLVIAQFCAGHLSEDSHGRIWNMIERIGPFAMVEIFGLALFLYSMKSGGVAFIYRELGMRYFTIAIFASVLCPFLTRYALKIYYRESPNHLGLMAWPYILGMFVLVLVGSTEPIIYYRIPANVTLARNALTGKEVVRVTNTGKKPWKNYCAFCRSSDSQTISIGLRVLEPGRSDHLPGPEWIECYQKGRLTIWASGLVGRSFK